MDQREFFSEATESNRYKLSEVIGKGSYGVVASAVDQFTGGCWPIAGWLVRLRLGLAGLGLAGGDMQMRGQRSSRTVLQQSTASGRRAM